MILVYEVYAGKMIQSLVKEVLQSQVLTPAQEQQLSSFLLRPDCTIADLESLSLLTDALHNGSVIVPLDDSQVVA